MRWMAVLALCVLLAAARPAMCFGQGLDHALLGKAQALLREGKAEEAWQLLAPRERQYAGQPDFDYVLGIAALESSRPNRATFVLERVLTVNPGHLAARLEMARAYFALGDYERAQREFDVLLGSSASPATRELARRYLARMGGATAVAEGRLTGYAEIATGRDTNVAAASAQSTVFIPALGTELAADALSQRRPDDFFALGAGADYAYGLSADFTLIGGVELRQRWNADMERYDSRSAELHGTLVHQVDARDRVQYGARFNHYELGHARYRETRSLSVEWARGLGSRTRLALSSHVYAIRYRTAETQSASSDLVAGAAGFTHLAHARSRTVVSGNLYLGHDNALAGREDGDRRLYGVAFGLQRRLAPRLEGFARLSVLRADYQQENAAFNLTRRDRQRDAVIGAAWAIGEHWSLRPQVASIRNRSNLPLSDYRRTETSITLTRSF